MNRNRVYVALILLAVAGYWYFSPYLTVYRLQAAARARDAAAFNQHVDYPRLRDSVKQQLVDMAGEDSFANQLGLLVVDKLVDAFVRPEAVMLAMQKGVWKPRQKHAGVPDEPAQEPHWSASHQGVNTFIVRVDDGEGGADQKPALVLSRQGFADWKLTAIRFPADLRQP